MSDTWERRFKMDHFESRSCENVALFEGAIRTSQRSYPGRSSDSYDSRKNPLLFFPNFHLVDSINPCRVENDT